MPGVEHHCLEHNWYSDYSQILLISRAGVESSPYLSICGLSLNFKCQSTLLVLESIRSGKYSFHSGSVSHSIRVVYNVAS